MHLYIAFVNCFRGYELLILVKCCWAFAKQLKEQTLLSWLHRKCLNALSSVSHLARASCWWTANLCWHETTYEILFDRYCGNTQNPNFPGWYFCNKIKFRKAKRLRTSTIYVLSVFLPCSKAEIALTSSNNITVFINIFRFSLNAVHVLRIMMFMFCASWC